MSAWEILLAVVLLEAAAVLVLLAHTMWRTRAERLNRRRAEEKYRLLFEKMREGVFISTPDGRFVDFNEAFRKMLGYESRAELLGVDIATACFANPADRERYKAILREQGSVANYEFQMRRRDGHILTVSESSLATRDESGAVTSIQGFILDVTERKQAELQLLQSEKMAAMGQLISGVAHELNNPLTAILGYSQLLAGSAEVSVRGNEYVKVLHRQAQRTHRIVQNLLSFARQHKPERASVALHEVLEDTLTLRAYELKLSNIRVHKEWANDLPLLFADRHQLQQVFLNILNNAVDAILGQSESGEIWVRTEAAPNGRSAARWVCVEFTDSGPGVTEPLRVFDPFFTTKPVGKGTGLGLSICYGIIKEHGGEIEVRNSPPRGATFTITLPPAPEQAAIGKISKGTEDVAPGGCVLIVDDEESVLELEREVLRACPLRVLAARNGREAIAILETESVDVVVTDLKMPGDVSGEQVYRWIARHRPEMAPRVVFTLSDEGTAAVRALLAETRCAHIQKPFRMEEFVRVVQFALSHGVTPATVP